MKKKSTRRAFLKSGLAGLAVVSAAPAVLKEKLTAAGSKDTENRPQTEAQAKPIIRTLGRTGLKMPIISMGVMNADNPALVQAALDSGIIHLDTAHGYQRGRNEEMIGQVVKDRKRDSFIIATKVPGPSRNKAMQGLPPEEVVKMFLGLFDLSLERLKLDYVDIFYYHNVDKQEDVHNQAIIESLKQAKKAGKTRFVGITTHANEPAVIRAAIEAKIYDVILTSYNFRQSHREEVRKAIAEAAQAGVGIVAMKTLAGVFWDKEKQQPINARAALKWALNDSNVTTAIPGFTTFDQLKDDLTVMYDLKLTPEEVRDLRLGESAGGLYCQQCSQCLPGCPKSLPIPDLMRGYMYAYGYRDLALAHEVVSSLEIGVNPCSSCQVCRVKCAKLFNVRQRIEEVTRLADLPADLFV